MVLKAILIVIVLLFFVFYFFVHNYRRCSSDKIMVICGKVGGGSGESRSARCIHGGAAFVWPIFQEAQFLDLTPFPIVIDLKGALSKQNIRVNIQALFTIAISTENHVMQNAAESLLGFTKAEIKNLATEIIFGQLRLVVATMKIQELVDKRDRFEDEVRRNVEDELAKIGLCIVDFNIADIKDEAGYMEALAEEAEARIIAEAKRAVAEAKPDRDELERQSREEPSESASAGDSSANARVKSRIDEEIENVRNRNSGRREYHLVCENSGAIEIGSIIRVVDIKEDGTLVVLRD